MNFGEMKDWVARTVHRPEKRDDEIADAVCGAIELATSSGDFANDLVESSVAISSSLYAQNITISSTFPRFRKIKYLRPTAYRKYITWRDPSRIFDENGCESVDVWYRAGDEIIFKLSVLQSTMLYAYYQYRARAANDDDTYTHWMLDQIPTCMHDLACGRVFNQIGNAEEANRYTALGMAFLKRHIQDLQDGAAHS